MMRKKQVIVHFSWIGGCLLLAGACVYAWFRTQKYIDQIRLAGGHLLLHIEHGSLRVRGTFPEVMYPSANTIIGSKLRKNEYDGAPIFEFWTADSEMGFGISWLLIAGTFSIAAFWPVTKWVIAMKNSNAQQAAALNP